MTAAPAGLTEVWPLFGLSIATPRLTLTPVRDDQLPGLIDAILAGIHDPSVMPFSIPCGPTRPGTPWCAKASSITGASGPRGT